MPHLNSKPFTEERLRTILAQTFTNWELIIVDSSSDDGSLKLLESYAAREPRIQLSQAPRDGIYSNLNRALEKSHGEFIYIATSDDTMKPECLERMVKALQQNPDCGLCHCSLEVIDENGICGDGPDAWEKWVKQQLLGDWIRTPHIRRAPHDGLLHFYAGTVYTSLTQLLIRRRVFEDLGKFRTDCGSYADFEWGMRVALNENVIYIPEKLASWRQHRKQATQASGQMRVSATGEFSRLAKLAIKSLRKRDPKLARALRKSDLNRFYLVNERSARQRFASTPLEKFLTSAGFGLAHPFFTTRWIFTKVILRRKMTGEFQDAFQTELLRLGYRDLIRSLEHDFPGAVENSRDVERGQRLLDRESGANQLAAGHSPASN